MTVAALSTTTLSAALTATERRFAVASTTGIAAATVLSVGRELMLVQVVPSSGVVEVVRGWNGSEAVAHPASATVAFGAADKFDRLSEFGLVTLIGDQPSGKPRYQLPIGVVLVDPHTGYEYMVVDAQAAFVVGEVVIIDGGGLATQLAIGSKGRVGVIIEAAGASDTLALALITGSYASALFDSDVTTAMQLGAAAGFFGPYDSVNHVLVNGATCTVAPSTATSPTVGDALGTVYLNRAWVDGVATFVS